MVSEIKTLNKNYRLDVLSHNDFKHWGKKLTFRQTDRGMKQCFSSVSYLENRARYR